VDPFIAFAETMQAALQELMAHAGVRREEIAKEKAEEAAKVAAGGAPALPQRH
jgi:hypothetical protein